MPCTLHDFPFCRCHCRPRPVARTDPTRRDETAEVLLHLEARLSCCNDAELRPQEFESWPAWINLDYSSTAETTSLPRATASLALFLGKAGFGPSASAGPARVALRLARPDCLPRRSSTQVPCGPFQLDAPLRWNMSLLSSPHAAGLQPSGASQCQPCPKPSTNCRLRLCLLPPPFCKNAHGSGFELLISCTLQGCSYHCATSVDISEVHYMFLVKQIAIWGCTSPAGWPGVGRRAEPAKTPVLARF